ncbi:GNAT family N-acetyltransferase [Gracilibacillus alcaliphilus]|uniref:GNAT family N-acetyltransferase n=1 Tax=Gracilibacillus alcaliphilus TaxID=1401441 RepID=UPI00195F22A4|nr:GNAT family N-acetyltransferase [Gracilibacillus alcaliphilus]MBM7676707.1 hypothetical protein [Gracilibacillus alcaliphilus]
MYIPSISIDLANRIERAEKNILSSRLDTLKQLTGNPLGIEVEEWGGVSLFSCKGIPGPSFNKVIGLTSKEEKYVDDMINFYDKRKIACQLEIIPEVTSPSFLKWLHSKGFYQSSFRTALYGIPEKYDNNYPNLSITEMKADDFAVFGDIYVDGFGLPSFLSQSIADNNKVLHKVPDWHFYLAKEGDKPLGLGVYYKQDKTAILAAAATRQQDRGKGSHSALISRRITQAFLDDCDLVVGQAAFASTSMQNMQRKGMQIAYTKAIWTRA